MTVFVRLKKFETRSRIKNESTRDDNKLDTGNLQTFNTVLSLSLVLILSTSQCLPNHRSRLKLYFIEILHFY